MKKISSIILTILFIAKTSYASDNEPSLLGPARLGALVGIGAPSPFSGQIVFKYKDLIGFNSELSFLPEFKLPIKETFYLEQNQIDFSGRVYPFRGMFFLGCGVGLQQITIKNNYQSNNPSSTDINNVFISPRLGILHRFNGGFSLGMDLGALIPFSSSIRRTNSEKEIPKEVYNISDAVEKTPIPFIHLLQIGYIF